MTIFQVHMMLQLLLLKLSYFVLKPCSISFIKTKLLILSHKVIMLQNTFNCGISKHFHENKMPITIFVFTLCFLLFLFLLFVCFLKNRICNNYTATLTIISNYNYYCCKMFPPCQRFFSYTCNGSVFINKNH